jgi:D-erythronate 2-dehydrogenase
MKILVVGAAGMIGRKLVDRIAKDGELDGRPVDQLTLVDVVVPERPGGFAGTAEAVATDLSVPGQATAIVASRPDVIFHLAAVVSGEAEANFTKGYAVNLDGSRLLFEAIRLEGEREAYYPRVVFCSSLAVFGPPFPRVIGDEFLTAPQTSYGTQKAISELLLADYSRRGIFDGIGLRLPTICIRPGKPNAAASGFFSNILREPLVGREAVLPVADTVRHWFASPRAAVNFLIHGATIDLSSLGTRRNLIMPGLSATVAEEIEALREVAGEMAVRLIRREPDERIIRIVSGWAEEYAPELALSLGFRAESTFAEIIRAHVEDELGGEP